MRSDDKQDQSSNSPVLVVANPSSRGGKSEDKFPEVKKLLVEHGLEFVFRYTQPGDETAPMVSRAIVNEDFRTVIYMGGDGTFNEVAKGVCASGIPGSIKIGMLPSGTANDQGKSFGIESTAKALRRNVEIIADGFTTNLDVGEITTYSENDVVMRRDLFFDSAGWGLSAAILSFRNNELELVKKVPVVREIYKDHMVYVRAVAHELAQSWLMRDTFNVVLDIDGVEQQLEGLTDLVVSNTAIYAGDWIVDAESEHDDGMFEVATFQGVRDWASKAVLNHKKVKINKEMASRLRASHSPTFKGSTIKGKFIKLSTKKKLLAQLDGEEFLSADHFKIVVHKQMLKLIVPRDFHWI